MSAMKERVLARVARTTGMPLPSAEAPCSQPRPSTTRPTLSIPTSSAGKGIIVAIIAGVVAVSVLREGSAPVTDPAPSTEPSASLLAPSPAPQPYLGAPATAAPSVDDASRRSAAEALRGVGGRKPSKDGDTLDPTPVVDVRTLPSVTTAPAPRPVRPKPPQAASGMGERGQDSLLAEGAAIERARAAIRRGDAASALVAVEEHANEFPAGQLAEERESLRIRVLVMLGRYEDARSAADRFAMTHPRSLFKPIVAKAIESIP